MKTYSTKKQIVFLLFTVFLCRPHSVTVEAINHDVRALPMNLQPPSFQETSTQFTLTLFSDTKIATHNSFQELYKQATEGAVGAEN